MTRTVEWGAADDLGAGVEVWTGPDKVVRIPRPLGRYVTTRPDGVKKFVEEARRMELEID